MGHEYIELKNSNAAIEAYRRAAGRSTAVVLLFNPKRTYLTQT